jgi:predicted membrane protein
MRIKFSSFIWGIFLIFIAAFIVFNQFDNFADLGIGSIIVASLAIIFIISCIASLNIAHLPVPLAVLYIIFHAHLNLPEIGTAALIIASILVTIGLSILLPKRHRKYNKKFTNYNKPKDCNQQVSVENSYDNNPSINVSFGATKHILQANSLEYAQLNCNFGSLEVYFDHVTPNPNGVTVDLKCSFGAIQLYIPRHWHVIDRVNCSMGGVDIDRGFSAPGENTPQITIIGSVSLGGVEISSL